MSPCWQELAAALPSGESWTDMWMARTCRGEIKQEPVGLLLYSMTLQ